MIVLVLVLATLTGFVEGRWINPSLWQAVLFGLVAVLLWRRTELVWSWGIWPLMGVVVWGLVQLGVGSTVSRWETWMAVLGWAGNLAGFWVALQVRNRVGVLKGMVVFAFVAAVVGVLQWFSAPSTILWFYEVGYPMMGPVGNRDTFAEFAELTMPVAVWLGVREERGRWFWLAAGAALFAVTIAGASRAGGVLIVGEAVVLAVLMGGRVPGKGWVVLGGMVVVFTAVVGVEALAARFGEAEPYNDRKAYVESAARMVRERPGMGFGLGNWENAYPKYSKGVDPDKVVNHAHNDWAEWAVEGGLPLLAMMVAMGVWVVPKAVGSVWGLGVAGVVAHSLVDFPMQKPAMALWMFVVMGLVAGYAGDHLSEVARDPLKGGEVLELTGPE